MFGFSFKEKMEHHAKQTKKGATKATGKELTDFERGVHMGKLQSMNSRVSSFYAKNPDKLTDEKRAKRDNWRAKEQAKREAFNNSKMNVSSKSKAK